MLAARFHTPLTFWIDPETDPRWWATAVAVLEEEDRQHGGD